MKRVYPDHMYEPIRREIAVSIIRRELKKYLPSIRGESQWSEIKKDIDAWFTDSPCLYPVRDFWNGFHGIVMGFKLLNHLTAFLTAENVEWSKESIAPEALYVPHQGEPGKIIDPNDPVIVTQKRIDGKDKLVVYDGGNRVKLALKNGSRMVNAYVGRFKDESRTPKNYWLPTSLLMEMNHFAKKVFERNDEKMYRCYIEILRDMLKDSDSAKYEMKNRVVPDESEYKRRILTDLGL